jgi:hypothetical protein
MGIPRASATGRMLSFQGVVHKSTGANDEGDWGRQGAS